jgi:multidrug efflux pump subunit AcrB
MVRYLLKRPVAVLVCFAVALALGIYLLRHIPISLLPQADVPSLTVTLAYPNTPAVLMEQNMVKPIREALTTLQGCEDIQSQTTNNSGYLNLRFAYGTRMDLAIVEANEKLDRVMQILPRDMPRPQVVRAQTTDIPIVRIQVVPRTPDDMAEATTLTYKVLKRRLEQMEGVSVVDVSGGQAAHVIVTPKRDAMRALQLSDRHIEQAIMQANTDLGSLSLKDGQYRYYVRVANAVGRVEQMLQIPVPLPGGGWVDLGKIAEISWQPVAPQGFHLYNGQEGLVITVQKTTDSRLTDLLPQIEQMMGLFQNDYPAFQFTLTQNQYYLLEAGISNLKQDLLYGGLATILLLFAFLGNWRSPLIMSISIPVSLLFTFILFKAFGISFNIISLSGLTLGIGNLIDNTVIVVDHIIRRRRTGTEVVEAAVAGTNEVIVPITSQVLTTVAVYAPLIILSGLAGILVTEQGIALSISLGVSLTVAFVLAPLLYTFLFKKEKAALREDTLIYRWINKQYHRMINLVLRYRRWCFGITLLLMPVGFLIAPLLPVQSLPPVAQTETLCSIDWNEPIDAVQNRRRVQLATEALKGIEAETEAEVGIQQFSLQQQATDMQQAILYLKCSNETKRIQAEKKLTEWLLAQYPLAQYTIAPAPNAFTQLFSRNLPHIEARLYPPPDDLATLHTQDAFAGLLPKLPVSGYQTGADMVQTNGYELILNRNYMSQYGITDDALQQAMARALSTPLITAIKRFGDVIPVVWQGRSADMETLLSTTVIGTNGTAYPLSTFITPVVGMQPKYITADKAGVYHSLKWAEGSPDGLQQAVDNASRLQGWQVKWTGTYFEDKAQIDRIWLIFSLVVFLLYLILVIQYESLIQPLVVMLTIPLGVSGAMAILWLTGGSLNVMAAVGFIVVLGLIVDDPILKIETLNRLEKKYRADGLSLDEGLLKRMIHEAGDICLKPLLMVSLTTSIALVPVLLIPGIGNDLQKPLALVVIGGLTIGTFFTTWFIPLAYWYYMRWKNKSKM